MKILYLTEFLSPIGGGGETSFYDLARSVAANNDVFVLCHESNDARAVSAHTNGGSLVVETIKPMLELRHGFFPSTAQQIRYIARLVAAGSKIIRHQGIDLIHANTLSPVVAGSILGSMHRIPVVATFHHLQDARVAAGDNSQATLAETISRHLRAFCDRAILLLPLAAVHAVSDSTATAVKKSGYRGVIEVVPNGLEFDHLQQSGGPLEYQPFLLFIGRLVKSKNLPVVLHGFADVLRVVPSAKLVVVGDGPMREKWKTQAVDLGIDAQVEFTGYVSEERKIDLLRRCSALVFPSLMEGFGMVILEAFAMKKPVIASSIHSSAELISQGVDGFLLPTFSSKGWGLAMAKALLNPHLCEDMGTRGWIKVRREFPLSDIAKRLEDAYRRICESEPAQKVCSDKVSRFPLQSGTGRESSIL